MEEVWPIADSSGMTREDERYLSELSLAADVPALRLWWLLVFKDISVLNDFERERLAIIVHSRRT